MHNSINSWRQIEIKFITELRGFILKKISAIKVTKNNNSLSLNCYTGTINEENKKRRATVTKVREGKYPIEYCKINTFPSK